MDASRVEWTAPALADEVGELRRAVTATAAEHGLAGLALERLELALSETLTNVVLHAYYGAPEPGPMTVELEADPNEVRVTVRDCGRGMAPRANSSGLGLGLGLAATVADRCELRTARATGTTVMLAFLLDAESTSLE
ncbi:MAG: serine/threonine-protein kinase RsbW [Solirubrobacteraceae bacterium]|nr:serine/threonine-protein kinase RsbW [Solirubrobacteraceae bacterium]